MSERFSAFSFVDRITRLEPGTRAEGCYAVPAALSHFPHCLAAEAVGQLAAWVSMSRLDFRLRPVAGIAAETRFFNEAMPGQALDLEIEIESCDEEAVAYSGWARVKGAEIVELKHSLGPMLPIEEFDAAEDVRARFEVLRGAGARTGRFRGIVSPQIVVTDRVRGESLRADLYVPASAPYFADHFPRRAVFPATLLLDAQIQLALQLASEVPRSNAERSLKPARVTDVKMRAFIPPGETVELRIESSSRTADTVECALVARLRGKLAGSARVEIVPRSA
jgi:3-hydroxymyristoyl/3-hydroxydecanoyl-(acyl carrier protein) dehydratase